MPNSPLKPDFELYRRLRRSSATLTVLMAAFAIALVLTLVTASSQNVISEETPAESSNVTLTATRTSDGTGADVSWTKYSGTNFYYYRFVVCSDANFSGSSCSNNAYNGTPYFNVNTTGPINVPDLDPNTSYNVILQIWRHNVQTPIKVYATIAAVPTPSPTSTATPEKRSKYPKLEPFLHDLTDTYDSDAANRARENLSTNCAKVQCVGVFIFTSGDQSAIKRFIRDKKIDAPRFEDDFIFAYPPIGLLGSLSKQDGVRFVKQAFQLSFPGSKLWLDPRFDPSRSKTIQSSVHIPTTEPAKESNADKWHGADDWHKDGYKGKNVNVGIIDGGFEGFSKLQKWKRLPKSVQSMCHYEIDDKVVYEVREITDAYVSKCENGEKHGSAVTEAIYDIAPDADVYISNIIDYDSLVRAVDWLVDTNKVKVINFSASTQFEETGDGISKTEEALLKIIEDVREKGVLWFNAAGNSGGGRMFHRDFSALDKNTKEKAWEGGWMDFADAPKNGVQADSNSATATPPATATGSPTPTPWPTKTPRKYLNLESGLHDMVDSYESEVAATGQSSVSKHTVSVLTSGDQSKVLKFLADNDIRTRVHEGGVSAFGVPISLLGQLQAVSGVDVVWPALPILDLEPPRTTVKVPADQFPQSVAPQQGQPTNQCPSENLGDLSSKSEGITRTQQWSTGCFSRLPNRQLKHSFYYSFTFSGSTSKTIDIVLSSSDASPTFILWEKNEDSDYVPIVTRHSKTQGDEKVARFRRTIKGEFQIEASTSEDNKIGTYRIEITFPTVTTSDAPKWHGVDNWHRAGRRDGKGGDSRELIVGWEHLHKSLARSEGGG